MLKKSVFKNILKSPSKKIISLVAIVWSLLQLYYSCVGTLPALQQRAMNLFFILWLVFMLQPGFPTKENKRQWYDVLISKLLAIIGMTTAFYIVINYFDILYYAGYYNTLEVIMGISTILVIFEATRRSLGPALPIVSTIFILYGMFGKYLPAVIGHTGQFTLKNFIGYLFYSTEGIFGTALGIIPMVFMFLLFGAFLEISGGGDFFVNIITSVFGHFRGGPAKSAVVASGFFGSISGSAVANVVATGSFTIPMMKKLGYSSDFAGGVEAAASSGGQITPPIMGAAAFLIAEFLGISYISVLFAAFIPAFLYYLAIFIEVHCETLRLNIGKIPKEELPDAKAIFLSQWYLFIPLIVLLYLLVGKKYSPLLSSFWAIITIIIIMILENLIKNRGKLNIKQFVKNILIGLESGALRAYKVGSACACAGVILGVIMVTGLGVRISNIILELSGGNLLILLVLTMVASIILGMGLPVTVVYLLTVILIAPALTKIGVYPLAAHLFALHFASISNVTPPFALAAYAAAAIADSDPVKTGLTAFRITIVAFIVPFFFVYNPSIILHGTFLQIIIGVCTAIIGCSALAISVSGYLHAKISIFNRLVLAISSVLLFIRGGITDIVGLLLLTFSIFFHYYYEKN